jgi:hypothetical protein
MMRLLGFWLDLCLLRAEPQALPASRWLLGFALACYLLLSLTTAGLSGGFVAGLQVAVLDVVLLCGFVVALLYLVNKPRRISQTLSALAGAGCILAIPAILLTLVMDSGIGPDTSSLSMLWLLLLFWNLLVTAHIIRHALSSSLALGIGLSLVYLLVSTQIMVSVFPELAGQ